MCDEDPGLCTGDGFSPVFRQTSTSVQPGEAAPDDPLPWQHFKALRRVGAFDDPEGPSAVGLQSVPQSGPGIPAIRKYMSQ